MAQDVRLERGVHDLGDVGTGIREGDDRPRVLHQLERVILVLVRDGLEEEPLQVLLECQVDHRLDRVEAALARDVRHRAARPVDSVEQEDPLVGRGPGLGADRAPLVALARGVDQAAAQRRIPQTLPLLGEGERA